MRTIIKSLVIASALMAGGAAYANDGPSDRDFNTGVAASQLNFAGQSNGGYGLGMQDRSAIERSNAAERAAPQASSVQGFAPVDTQRALDGAK